MTGSGTTARLQVKVRGNVLCYDLIFGFCVYIYAERERETIERLFRMLLMGRKSLHSVNRE